VPGGKGAAMHDFDETGYLGEGIRQFRESTLASFKQFFTLSRTVCSFARGKILQLKVDHTDGQQVLSCYLFAKILNGVETAHILSTYGLTHEGRVILRSVLEGFFYLRATVSDTAFVQRYIQADELNRLTLMKAAKKYDQAPFSDIRNYATDEVIQAQQKKIEKQNIKKLILWDIVHKLGLLHMYDSLYRLLSTDIHASVRSLEQYMKTGATGDIESLDWGPQSEDVPQNLSMGIDTVIRSLECMDNLFVMGIRDELKTYMKQLETTQQEHEKREAN
jgi:hypothetical protein